MPAMNDRAREILTYIQRFSRDHGYPPTIREIGEAFEINSTNGVRYYLQMLEQGGFMTRSSKRSRGIELKTAPRTFAPAGPSAPTDKAAEVGSLRPTGPR